MAKRKRLTPAQSRIISTTTAPAADAKGMFPLGVARHCPPIADVARDLPRRQAALDESGRRPWPSARARGPDGADTCRWRRCS